MNIQTIINDLSKIGALDQEIIKKKWLHLDYLLSISNSVAAPPPMERRIKIALIHSFLHYLNDNIHNGNCCIIITYQNNSDIELAIKNTRPNIKKLTLRISSNIPTDTIKEITNFLNMAKKCHALGIFCDMSSGGMAEREIIFSKCVDLSKNFFNPENITIMVISNSSDLPLQDRELIPALTRTPQRYPFHEENFEVNFIP
jgi:hypothetical protein